MGVIDLLLGTAAMLGIKSGVRYPSSAGVAITALLPAKTQLHRLALIVLVLGPITSASAEAAVVERRHLRGNFVFAFSEQVVDCVQTSMELAVADNRLGGGGAPVPSVSLFLSVLQFDRCSNALLLFGENFLEPARSPLTVKGSLDSARLLTTVSLVTADNRLVPIDIDLTWTASTSSESLRIASQFSRPGTLVIDRAQGRVEDNAAVTGTVTTPNVVLTAFEGFLAKNRVHSLVIGRSGRAHAPHGPLHVSKSGANAAVALEAPIVNTAGCVESSGSVTALAPTNNTAVIVTVQLQQVDRCTGKIMLATVAEVLLPRSDLKVSTNSSSAALKTSFEVGINGMPSPISLDMTWTANGAETREAVVTRVENGDSVVVNRLKGSTAQARVTGTITTENGTFALAEPLGSISRGSTVNQTIGH
jgi:hypothetical protein